MPKPKQREPNRYQAIILRLFEDHYTAGLTEFEFTRSEVDSISKWLFPLTQVSAFNSDAPLVNEEGAANFGVAISAAKY